MFWFSPLGACALISAFLSLDSSSVILQAAEGQKQETDELRPLVMQMSKQYHSNRVEDIFFLFLFLTTSSVAVGTENTAFPVLILPEDFFLFFSHLCQSFLNLAEIYEIGFGFYYLLFAGFSPCKCLFFCLWGGRRVLMITLK